MAAESARVNFERTKADAALQQASSSATGNARREEEDDNDHADVAGMGVQGSGRGGRRGPKRWEAENVALPGEADHTLGKRAYTERGCETKEEEEEYHRVYMKEMKRLKGKKSKNKAYQDMSEAERAKVRERSRFDYCQKKARDSAEREAAEAKAARVVMVRKRR
ncbi:hypothetical protein BDZ90DRAFT_105454 [Jaminaea rosea]|uniref:Uncharacterized protein n=1 Tax=Jaminaea rosea TaxID=1569628 RepID=A0A316UVL5_9BASI|nr:hypothetical protein BDZ90DRAFT_105454 [Jaminaea rosea]PWN29319.1 hypothetical protein BDZ90DRAFT_105454 [Jaminaea rosea]